MARKTREEKYPNTDTFKFYNANPKGRYTGDCLVRAICTALDKSYEEVYRELLESCLTSGYSIASTENFSKYLQSKGWEKMKQPKKSDNTKYTGEEFCEIFKGTCVANIGGHHTVCIKDGKVHDTWDSTDGCIGNYWVKK